jgi:fermentation-respiration switch protein FrsA (DUF1100 family)
MIVIKRTAAGLLILGSIAAAFIVFISLSDTRQEWSVTDDGLLHYLLSTPKYQSIQLEILNNSTLYEVEFASRDAQIAALLRKPQMKLHGGESDKGIPGVVLLPGATVTKEREQGLAKNLCNLGYAIITLDQRNLGAIDMQRDLKIFLAGGEAIEHMMVYDALAGAEILRNQPEIDPNRIFYIGESNGGRFAIIACALDRKARGVIVMSTSGYGIDDAIESGRLNDPDAIRFYKSIDPETYLGEIPPRKLVMIHSQKDPIINYEYANRTYAKALQPKYLYTVKCAAHGHCTEMDTFLKNELENYSA